VVLGGLAAWVGTFLVPAPRRLAARPDRIHRLRAGALGRSSDLAFLATRITNFGPRASPTVVDHVASVAALAPAEVWTNLLGSLAALDLGNALEHVRVPALVMVGDVDRLTPPATARSLVGALPDARLLVVRGAGHCAMLERHREFNAAIESFIGPLVQAAGPAVDRAPAPA
jgi:pimeloyl-ACP methyl ester carboxylesterase